MVDGNWARYGHSSSQQRVTPTEKVKKALDVSNAVFTKFPDVWNPSSHPAGLCKAMLLLSTMALLQQRSSELILALNYEIFL